MSSTVWKLGFTSLFTDVSAEMVSSILPLYFVFYLGFTPLQFGILDGLYQGAAIALLSLATGIVADRSGRHKEVAAAGYAFSALSKLGLMIAGSSWGAVAGMLAFDRFGKGIRTAPRDAMISLTSARSYLATAFAVHRALDTGGAVFGPLLAFLILRNVPNGYSLVLTVSFFVALIGVGLIGLLVEGPQIGAEPAALSFRVPINLWQRREFRRLTGIASALALTTASDAFIYLALQKNTNSPATALPVFAFITASVYMLLSVPLGRIADVVGRRVIFLAGYALVAVTYAILLAPDLPKPIQFAALVLLGAYYAATDGVLAALCSSTLQPELRATGLATLNTVVGVSKMASSILFGALWSFRGLSTPVAVFLAALAVALIVSSAIFRRTPA